MSESSNNFQSESLSQLQYDQERQPMEEESEESSHGDLPRMQIVEESFEESGEIEMTERNEENSRGQDMSDSMTQHGREYEKDIVPSSFSLFGADNYEQIHELTLQTNFQQRVLAAICPDLQKNIGVPEVLDRKIKRFMDQSIRTRSAAEFEETIFDSDTGPVGLALQGGVQYSKINKTLEVANLVLFDQLKELEALNVQFKRDIERKDLGITAIQSGRHPFLINRKQALTQYQRTVLQNQSQTAETFELMQVQQDLRFGSMHPINCVKQRQVALEKKLKVQKQEEKDEQAYKDQMSYQEKVFQQPYQQEQYRQQRHDYARQDRGVTHLVYPRKDMPQMSRDQRGDYDDNEGSAKDNRRRYRRTANEIERRFVCWCGKAYGSEGSLNQHKKIKGHHQEGDQDYEGPTGQNEYRQQMMMDSHGMMHQGYGGDMDGSMHQQ